MRFFLLSGPPSKTSLLIGLSLMLFAPILPSAEYHVSPSGSDGADGSSQAPWKTIGFAANMAKEGDTVVVGAGNYDEVIVVKVSGGENKPIVFRSEPKHEARVRGFHLMGDHIGIEGFDVSSHTFGIDAGQAHLNTARKGCRMIDNFLHDIQGTAIITGEHAVVRGNRMKDVYRGTFANSHSIIENNEIDTLTPKPLTEAEKKHQPKGKWKKTAYNFFSGDHITYRGNYLHGTKEEYLMDGMGVCFFASWDAAAFPPSRHILIEANRGFNATHASEPTADEKKLSSHITYRNNLFVNSVFVGIFPRNFSHITIENNTLINCGAYPVWFISHPMVEGSVVKNNLFAYHDRERTVKAFGWKTPVLGIQVAVLKGVDAGKIDMGNNFHWGIRVAPYCPKDIKGSDPLFVDPANHDYRLKPGSPAIGAGVPLDSVTNDLMGNPRPKGQPCSVGCYEGTAAMSTPAVVTP